MKIAIICPGPSMSHFDGVEEYDLVIGVNRAATKIRCGVWACGDFPMVEKTSGQVIGVPTLFMDGNGAAQMRDRGVPWAGRVEEFEQFYDGSEHSLKWNTFTATAALWYAAAKGGQLIRAFGCDWTGTKDVDGVEAGLNRSPERWELEKWIWGRVTEVLSQRLVVVERVMK